MRARQVRLELNSAFIRIGYKLKLTQISLILGDKYLDYIAPNISRKLANLFFYNIGEIYEPLDNIMDWETSSGCARHSVSLSFISRYHNLK